MFPFCYNVLGFKQTKNIHVIHANFGFFAQRIFLSSSHKNQNRQVSFSPTGKKRKRSRISCGFYTKLYWLSTARPESESIALPRCWCWAADVIVGVLELDRFVDDADWFNSKWVKSKSQVLVRVLAFSVIIWWGCTIQLRQKKSGRKKNGSERKRETTYIRLEKLLWIGMNLVLHEKCFSGHWFHWISPRFWLVFSR